MKNNKQKIAIAFVAILLIFTVYTGLVKPYMENKEKENIGNTQNEVIPVPNFQFTDSEGNTVDFEDFKGKPTVINFWGTWCNFCVIEMKDFNNLIADYGEDVNFLFLHVPNTAKENVEGVLQFLEDKEFDNITTHFDTLGQGTYMFGINSFPTTIFVDKDGNLFGGIRGLTNYDKVESVLESML